MSLLQVIRRGVQIAVIFTVVAVAFLSLYAHYRAARVIDDDQLMAGMRGEVAAKMIHPYVEKLDDPQAFLDGNKGTLWSMRLLGISVTDPLAAVEAIAASKHVHWPLLASILIPVLLTLIFGKIFCSWICPGYVLFEVAGKLRRLLRIAEIQPGRVRFSYANKYIFLVVGLTLAAMLSIPLFALIYPPAVISRAMHAWIFGTELAGMVLLLGIIVAVEVFVSPRWWCRTICPGGALYGLIGWARPVRVRLKREACTFCRACIPCCEAGINPITESSSIECDNCGVCIDYCGEGALKFEVGLPELPGKKNARKAKTVVSVIFFLMPTLFATPALAHHVLGLPHYSYKENYPQRPTLEYPATTGPYDVLLTSYPGVPTPGEPANLSFYIKDRVAKKVFEKPITVRVLRTSTFGDNEVIVPPTRREPFDNQHKFQCTFPLDAEYIVELSMEVEGRVEVIPFQVVAGEPSATASFAFAVAGGLLIVFIVIRAVQKKRQRRKDQTRKGQCDT